MQSSLHDVALPGFVRDRASLLHSPFLTGSLYLDHRRRYLFRKLLFSLIIIFSLLLFLFTYCPTRTDAEYWKEVIRDVEQARKTLEDRINCLKRSIMRNIRFLEHVFKVLMFIRALSVFPNERRPLCKTMPWDILPSLAILWGVWWMFYTPTNEDKTDEGDRTSLDNRVFNFPHSTLVNQLSLYVSVVYLINFSTGPMEESSSHQVLFSNHDSDQNWDWLGDDFVYIADRLQPWATPAEANLLPSAFQPISSVGINTIPGVFTVQSTDNDGGQILSGHGIISTIPRNEFSTETHGATGQFDTDDRQNASPTVPFRR